MALPDGHPLAGRPALEWAAVADARWLDAPRLAPPTGPGAAALGDRIPSRTRYDGTDLAALGPLVAAGHGLALVPGWWRPGADGVRLVPLAEPPWVHRVEVLVLRSRAATWAPVVARARNVMT